MNLHFKVQGSTWKPSLQFLQHPIPFQKVWKSLAKLYIYIYIYISVHIYSWQQSESSELNFWVWLQVFNKTLLKLDLLVYCLKSCSRKQCYNHALFRVINLQWVSVVLLVLISSSSWRKRRGLSTWKYHKVYRSEHSVFLLKKKKKKKKLGNMHNFVNNPAPFPLSGP